MMRYVFVALAFLLAAVAGWVGFQSYNPVVAKSRVIEGGATAFGAPFTLVDNKGQPITEKAFQGQPSAVFFGFTNCPEVCPTTLTEMDSWLKTLGDEGKDIRAYFVSVDPARDNVETMNRYVSNVSDRITGITGEPAKVEQMVRDFKIFYSKGPVDQDGNYNMDHTASVMLLNRKGDFFGTIAYEENPATALEKLRRLAKEG